MNVLTISQLVSQCENRLDEAAKSGNIVFGHGTTNAHDEAIWLVLWSLGLPIDKFDNVALLEVSQADALKTSQLISERINTRRPTAYLTNEAWLQGVSFYVDERSIVPRSFIAELIVGHPLASNLDEWLSEDTLNVLDLCTGNGSLAVLSAMAWPEVVVDAADWCDEALAVASINLAKHDLQNRITLIKSDGLSQVRGPYDLILCNPPYVNAKSMADLPAEYLAEPRLALASGADGMDFCRQLIHAIQAQPGRYLSDNGVLVLEIGHERNHFELAFPQLPVVWLETSAGVGPLLLITREALDLGEHVYS